MSTHPENFYSQLNSHASFDNSDQDFGRLEIKEQEVESTILPSELLARYKRIRLSKEVLFKSTWPSDVNWGSVLRKLNIYSYLNRYKIEFKVDHLLLLSGYVPEHFSAVNSLLYYAALSGNAEAVVTLVTTHGLDVNASDNNGRNLLHYGALSGNAEAVMTLVTAYGLDVNASDNGGRNLLHYAALSGNAETVMTLVTAHGLDVNARDHGGLNLLYYAAFSGDTEAVATLVATHGLDVNARTKGGLNLLHCAALSGHAETVATLAAVHGLDVNARTKGGLNLLHCAALSGHAEAVATLSTLAVVHGLDYNARDNEGHNPLHYAARSGSAAAVIALIALGFDPLSVDKWSNGLLFYARKSGNQDTINLCSDEIYCNQLFREKYLASFIPLFIADLNLPYSYPQDIAKIIGQYAAPYSKKEQSILERSVRKHCENRKKLLKPLIKYCKKNLLGKDASAVLNSLLSTKAININNIEQRLDNAIARSSHQNSDYRNALFQCRINTANKTGNGFKSAKQEDLQEYELSVSSRRARYSLVGSIVLLIAGAFLIPVNLFIGIAITAIAGFGVVSNGLVTYARRFSDYSSNPEELEAVEEESQETCKRPQNSNKRYSRCGFFDNSHQPLRAGLDGGATAWPSIV